MTFVIHDGEEFLLVGEASRTCREAVVEVPIGAGGQLAGVPVSPGRARGRAVLAVRNDESLRRRFRDGDVLVSVETDPDLVPVMRKASAIVTDLDAGFARVRQLLDALRRDRDGFRARSRALAAAQYDWNAYAPVYRDLYGRASAGAGATTDAVPRTRATPSAILETDFIETASC